MRIITIILSISAILFAGQTNWRFYFDVQSGRSQKFTIGMDRQASDHFDRGFDVPAPPATMAPPSGFYPYISFVDTNYRYLDAAWTDIRAISDSSKWIIILHHPETLTTITWRTDSIPIGNLDIDNIDIRMLDGKFIIPKSDTIFTIKYSRKPIISTEPQLKIDFNLPKPAKVNIVIYGKHWKQIDKLDYGTLVAGEYNKKWKPSAKLSGVFIYQVFADDILIAVGKLLTVSN